MYTRIYVREKQETENRVQVERRTRTVGGKAEGGVRGSLSLLSVRSHCFHSESTSRDYLTGEIHPSEKRDCRPSSMPGARSSGPITAREIKVLASARKPYRRSHYFTKKRQEHEGRSGYRSAIQQFSSRVIIFFHSPPTPGSPVLPLGNIDSFDFESVPPCNRG